MAHLSTRLTVFPASLCALLIATPLVHAQTTNPPVPPASGRIVKDNSPFTPIESDVGVAVENLCPSLVARSNAGINSPGSAERDLQVRCTEMVRAQDFNGVSGNATADILRASTAEEVATQGTQSVELSALYASNVLVRFEQLRTASIGGPVFAFDEETGNGKLHYEFGGGAGDNGFGRWSLYLNGLFATGDRNETPNAAGFDFDSGVLTFGADYRLGQSSFIGASLSWANSDADLFNGGKVEADSYGLLLYGMTYSPNDIYFEGVLGFGRQDYDQVRKINYSAPTPSGGATTTVRQDATSNTDGDELVASIGIGKDFVKEANTISLSGHLTYLDIEIDGYQENINNSAPGFGLALEVDKQKIDSLRSVIGLQFSRTVSTAGGVVVPYARGDWIHEFKNDQRQTRARFKDDPFTTGGFLLPSGAPAASTFTLITEAPDKDYFRLGAGISTVRPSGWQGFLALDALVGLKDINAYSIGLGVRKDI